MAADFASVFGASEAGRLAGYLHDIGKYRDQFQRYLRGECASSVETQHAVFGAAWAFRKANAAKGNAESMLFASVAFAVAGHHAGLHDLSDLQEMVVNSKLGINESIIQIMQRFHDELGDLAIEESPNRHDKSILASEFHTRMLFSCLVDADRLDSAFWPERPSTSTRLDATKLLAKLLAAKDEKQSKSVAGEIKKVRQKVFESCVESAEKEKGFFSLTVPTGGGKTISSMAFALAHARKHGHHRIVVVIPYLSIIEQNAEEYKTILGSEEVLEVHSAVQPSADNSEEENNQLELVSENWDAPIVVTTSVQFIESLFAAGPSQCRKLHRIANSVVIFDEVQTLPSHLLKPLFSVLRELVTRYGNSFLFCSATQPAFRKSSQTLPDAFSPEELREIAPKPEELFAKLKRVSYHFPTEGERISWRAVAGEIASRDQALCVVNLVRHARELWEEVRKQTPANQRPFHLSGGMCAQHRLDRIQEIRTLLRNGESCRVISTQLIEAGVDLDFPEVWRAMGPLDSIVQVAGRCNREGLEKNGNVHIFNPEEDALPRGLYSSATNQAKSSLAAMNGDTDRLATDPSVFSRYFEALYQLLETDKGEIQKERENLRFRKVAHRARVIEDSGQPVVVTYGDAQKLIRELRERDTSDGTRRFSRRDLRNFQRYMVNVRAYRFKQLLALKAITPLLPNLEIFLLNDGFYHSELGIVVENRPLEDFLQ